MSHTWVKPVPRSCGRSNLLRPSLQEVKYVISASIVALCMPRCHIPLAVSTSDQHFRRTRGQLGSRYFHLQTLKGQHKKQHRHLWMSSNVKEGTRSRGLAAYA